MVKVVMYGSVSVGCCIADEHDQPGPLFEWLSNGDAPLGTDGQLMVSQSSFDFNMAYWDQIGVTILGRRVFDLTDGWDATSPSSSPPADHMVVVTHRPPPERWNPHGSFFFFDGVEAAVAKAKELAGCRVVEVAAGDVGGKVFAAGLVDGVRMDFAPVVLRSGKRFYGAVDAPRSLDNPDVVVGNRVLHLRYSVSHSAVG